MRRVIFVIASTALATACATGAVLDPIEDDGTDVDSGTTTIDGGTTDGARVYLDAASRDASGSYTSDAAKAIDSAAPVDSGIADTGGGAVVDSAPPPPPPPVGGDCTGATSTQLGISYDTACHNYYENSPFPPYVVYENPCNPGGNDCASLNSGGTVFCCFTPPSGSQCESDYNGDPQCLPQ